MQKTVTSGGLLLDKGKYYEERKPMVFVFWGFISKSIRFA